jgi:putative peptidoglycan lipid II flippase
MSGAGVTEGSEVTEITEVEGSGRLWRAAGVMGVATLISRVLGLVREQVIAVMFGAGNATDAFNVAFRIPNLLRNLFAEGAMSASLVPVFTRARLEEGDARAWRVAGLVFRIIFISVGILALLGVVFADQLVGLYASSFKVIPGKYEMTVQMTRIMFPFFPLVALAAAFMGVLNACGVFFMPALSSALFNVASVIVGVLFVKWALPWTGGQVAPIHGMAIGVLVGGAVQAFCQLPSLYRAGYRWQGRGARSAGVVSWCLDPSLHRMLWMMVPGTIGLAATQINILVNTVFATSQGPGAVSWLSYAFRLMQFPIGIFGASLGAATLPLVSAAWVRKDIRGIESTLNESLRQVFAINLPASAGLAVLGYPIVELIFQYGKFYSEDAHHTARALTMYAIGLSAYSMVKVLVPACYAMGNIRIPVISSFISVISATVLNFLLIGPLGYWGLALAASCGAILNAVFLLVAVQKLLQVQQGNLGLAALSRALLQHLAVALIMGTVCYYSYVYLNGMLPDRIFLELSNGQFSKLILPLCRGVKVSTVILEGLFVVYFMARIFRIRDSQEVFHLFKQKLKNKLSRGVN